MSFVHGVRILWWGVLAAVALRQRAARPRPWVVLLLATELLFFCGSSGVDLWPGLWGLTVATGLWRRARTPLPGWLGCAAVWLFRCAWQAGLPSFWRVDALAWPHPLAFVDPATLLCLVGPAVAVGEWRKRPPWARQYASVLFLAGLALLWHPLNGIGSWLVAAGLVGVSLWQAPRLPAATWGLAAGLVLVYRIVDGFGLLPVQRLPEGSRVPPALLRTFTGLRATGPTRETTSPDWLVVSNSPEQVREAGVLCQEKVPAGQGRLLLSHYNMTLRAGQLVVDYLNIDAFPAHLNVARSQFDTMWHAFPLGRDPGLDCWLGPGDTAKATLGPGQSLRRAFWTPPGDAVLWEDVECDARLRVTTALVFNRDVDLEGPTLVGQPPQVRGVFLRPDRDVTVQMDSSPDAVELVRLADTPLSGQTGLTPVQLDGEYGSVTHVHVRMASSPRPRRVVVLLLPRGGWAGAVLGERAYSLAAGEGLVLFNRPVSTATTFDYDFTLPANSYGPVDLLCLGGD